MANPTYLNNQFLIAMPAMADPNFRETVTYLCKHDAEGAFGIILNRPGDLSLAELAQTAKANVAAAGFKTISIVHGTLKPRIARYNQEITKWAMSNHLLM